MNQESPDPVEIAAEIELIPEDYFAPLDLARVFPNPGPLEVDLGCGDGGFVVAQAERFPERNFLGIEKLGGRVQRASRKGARLGLRNVRILRVESAYAIQYLLPRARSTPYIYFSPIPGPRKNIAGAGS